MSKKKTEEGDGAVIEPSPPPPPPEDPPIPQVDEVEALRARVAELEASTAAAEARALDLEESLHAIRAEARRQIQEFGAKLRQLGEAAEAQSGSTRETDQRTITVELSRSFKSLTIAGLRLVQGAPVTIARAKLSPRQLAALKSDERVRVTERG